MKIIVIAGAGRNVGKTTVLRKLKALFPNSVSVKLGKVGEVDKEKEEILLPYDSTIKDILHQLNTHHPSLITHHLTLLIEGNAILNKIKPDLAVFVEGNPEKRKHDADEAKAKCDLVVENNWLSND